MTSSTPLPEQGGALSNKEQTELVEILQDTAASICGEWCDGSHEGAEAVKEHLSKERQALLDWRDKAVKEAVWKTMYLDIGSADKAPRNEQGMTDRRNPVHKAYDDGWHDGVQQVKSSIRKHYAALDTSQRPAEEE